MSTTDLVLSVSDIPVHITRKDVKRLHLSVYPPEGEVKVSAPLFMTDDNIRLAIINRLKWIRTQRHHFQQQLRQTERQMVSGESHYVWGARYCLDVHYRQGKHQISHQGRYLHVYVSPNTTRENRYKLLQDYYRSQLKQEIPNLLKKWQPIVGKSAKQWGIRRMKTKWGSCSPDAERIWLNLELAKKPIECLEYVLVHELVHFHEASHGDAFIDCMDKHLPNWRNLRKQLNSEYLAHEDWQ